MKPMTKAAAMTIKPIRMSSPCGRAPEPRVAKLAPTASRNSSSPIPGAPSRNVMNSPCTAASYRTRRQRSSRERVDSGVPQKSHDVTGGLGYEIPMNSTAHRIRVLTVDDHPMIRDGIAAAVGAQPDMQIVE